VRTNHEKHIGDCCLTIRMTRRKVVGVDAAVSGHEREIASNKDAAHGVPPQR